MHSLVHHIKPEQNDARPPEERGDAVRKTMDLGTLKLGNLRRTGLRNFEGELATSGCPMELALQETEDGQNLSALSACPNHQSRLAIEWR